MTLTRTFLYGQGEVQEKETFPLNGCHSSVYLSRGHEKVEVRAKPRSMERQIARMLPLLP